MRTSRRLLFVALVFICGAAFGSTEGEKDKKIETSYDNGILFQTSNKKFSLKLNGQTQIRHQYLAVENGADTNSFTLRLMRLALSGHLFTPDLTYLSYLTWDNNAAGTILDLFIQYRFHDAFKIKAGQYKPLFSREWMSDQMKLSFADMTNQINQANGFNLNRDIGVTLFGTLLNEKLDYALYTFNGNGRAVANSNKEMFFGTRLVANLLGKPGYRINDFDPSQTPQLAVGVAFAYDPGSDNAAIPQHKLIRSTGDVVLLYKGFAIGAEGHFLRNTTADATNSGFEGHTSYFLIPKKLEIAGRAAGTFRQDGGVYAEGNVNTYEAGAALGYYFYGTNVKLLADYTLLWNNGAVQGQQDHQLRAQMQLHF